MIIQLLLNNKALLKSYLRLQVNPLYIIAVATIMEKEDDYTLICDIQGLGRNVLVEFEEKVSVEIGASLRIKGNLNAELDD